MKKENLIDALNDIDEDMIDAAEQKRTKKQTKTLIKWASVAACLVLVLAISLSVILPLTSAPPHGPDTQSPNNDPPSVSTITSGVKITGVQELIYGNAASDAVGDPEIIPPGFYIRTVVEARVIEVLSDRYYLPDQNLYYHVARLSVVDAICGEGIPKEIFLRFPYYASDVLDGHDTFLFSLEQIGTENYMMINDTKKEVTYFSDMFQVETVNDLGYGSVIAFKDGKVDVSFWNKVTHFNKIGWIDHMLDAPKRYFYPVGHDSTLEEAKASIAALAELPESESMYVNNLPCDYVTDADIFVSEEGRRVKEYMKASSSDVFMQKLTVRDDRVFASYTRVINGFITEEKITVNGHTGENGNVVKYGEAYSAEDLTGIPDIGNAIAKLPLSELQPPHVEITEGMHFKYSIANGFYRKAEGKVYGIVRVFWYYTYPEMTNAYIRDDCYYLYGADGSGKFVEREELRDVIGDDPLIASFPYDEIIAFD